MNDSLKPVSRRVTWIVIVALITGIALFVMKDPAVSGSIENISPEQANRLVRDNNGNADFVILDIRTRQEFRTGHLVDAILIDFYSKDFLENINQLDKNKTYLVYCRSANRSTKAMKMISGMGFLKIYNMDDGIIGWNKKGFKIQSGTSSPVFSQNLPGTETYDAKLTEEISAMQIKKGTSYKPRTKHLEKNGQAKYTNRLFLETSPYLLQHAHNPVNWYPWGEEAFEAAREKNLPVLLSIGYSTCHWCHVMEEESFEDVEIAKYINENYIAIKVDREERPDIDAIYMSAVQAITGRGGWPMTVWLTQDRKPFYGGTYFPARDGDRGTGMGFLTVLGKVKESWDQKPDLIQQSSDRLATIIKQILTPEKGDAESIETILETAVADLKSGYDKINGGVMGYPKFPSSMPVRLLLRYYHKTQDQTVLGMAEKTLSKMASGGIYDHVGGGFHRYTTDEKWKIPHFEKMLYDNALLIMAYLDGYQVTGRQDFKQIVDETLLYIKREMTAPSGGFYSAIDADSLTPDGKREEGYYYTWTKKELSSILGKESAKAVAAHFDVTAKGNFEGRNIFNIKTSPEINAKDAKMPQAGMVEIIQDAKSKLYAHRTAHRPVPIRDEKILTAWNGLMISAYARSGFALENTEYIQTAQKAARFILTNLFKDNHLFRSHMDGQARHNAYLDDYSFLIAALLDLFEVDPDPYWFESAVKLEKIMSDRFEDKKDGGYFMTADNHEKLIAREKPGHDSAIPSGNSIAAMNLLRLYEFTTDDRYRKKAVNTFKTFSKLIESSPHGVSEMLMAINFSQESAKEIVIVSPKGNSPENETYLNAFRKIYLPNRVLIHVKEGENDEQIGALLPIAKGKTTYSGKPIAYICENGICRLPSFTVDEFKRQLNM